MGWIIAGALLGSGLLGVAIGRPEILVNRGGQMVRIRQSALTRFVAGVLNMLLVGVAVAVAVMAVELWSANILEF
jgi:hypothetical protein